MIGLGFVGLADRVDVGTESLGFCSDDVGPIIWWVDVGDTIEGLWSTVRWSSEAVLVLPSDCFFCLCRLLFLPL